MKNIRIKTLLALVGMFILGAVAGWFQGRYYEHSNPRVSVLHPTTEKALEDHMIERLTEKLSLNPSQVQSIRPIIAPVTAKIVETQNEMLDKTAAILADRDTQIIPLLNDDQKPKLVDMEKQRKKFLNHPN